MYKRFIANILSDGNSVSVFDGEEWQVKESTKFLEIIRAIESVDIAEINVYRDEEYIGWAQVCGNIGPATVDYDEAIIDFTTPRDGTTGYMEKVWIRSQPEADRGKWSCR